MERSKEDAMVAHFPPVTSLRSLLIGWLMVGGFCLAVTFGPSLLLRGGGAEFDAIAALTPPPLITSSAGLDGR